MPKALWKDKVIAESERVEVVEGNTYFPPGAIRKEHFGPSATRTDCHWKGIANYYNVVVDGEVNEDAAWFYPDPKAEAGHIKDHVAFWRGVKIEQ
ncbi:MAG: DUF427 domain-containing protein [Betaproteobacteria bacterium]